MRFTSEGLLVISPKLLGAGGPWWAILECDREIGHYYRRLHYLGRHRTSRLARPAWGCHVTVVRNEEPPEDRKPHWHCVPTSVVEFTVTGPPDTNGYYWWLPVECDELGDIRYRLGLPREPAIPFHLSIGHEEEK